MLYRIICVGEGDGGGGSGNDDDDNNKLITTISFLPNIITNRHNNRHLSMHRPLFFTVNKIMSPRAPD
jgi:hypothetical protein